MRLFNSPLLTRSIAWARLLYQKRSFWFRALFCWAFAILVLTGDETTSHDLRFQIRGDQTVSPNIILVTVRGSEVITLFESGFGSSEQKDISLQSDAFFWDQKLWAKVLRKILAQNPRTVGVSFFFGDNIGKVSLTPEEKSIFFDSRVFWSANLYNREIPLMPAFGNAKMANVGIAEWMRDEDGVIRRFTSLSSRVPHLALKLAQSSQAKQNSFLTESRLINFRGDPGIFREVHLSEVLLDKIPPTAFQDKIVIIGAEMNSGASVMTPVGPMSRAELLATVVDNLLNDRWIKRFSQAVYWLGLFFVMLVAVWIISTYPQTVALFLILWYGLLLAALSAWIFDSFYLWLPALSSVLELVVIWTIFIGYQATKMEQRSWHLQQEQVALRELEQLKNNFVSLISHDLKTPIAKIQGAIDRIYSRPSPPPEVAEDLNSIRNSSDELHRYIQSILKVLRVESRDFRIHKEIADVNELIEEVVTQLTPLAASKNIRIDKNLEPLFSVEYDVTLMKEVILNLVENSIKYTPANGQIKIMSRELDQDIEIDVIDNGEGIGPDELQNVWGKFVRGKNQDLKTKGTGLGLYLVKYFVELHGGTVALDSKVGLGTKVTVKLPLEVSGETEGIVG